MEQTEFIAYELKMLKKEIELWDEYETAKREFKKFESYMTPEHKKEHPFLSMAPPRKARILSHTKKIRDLTMDIERSIKEDEDRDKEQELEIAKELAKAKAAKGKR